MYLCAAGTIASIFVCSAVSLNLPFVSDIYILPSNACFRSAHPRAHQALVSRLELSSLAGTMASLSSITCVKHPSGLQLHVGPLRRPALVHSFPQPPQPMIGSVLNTRPNSDARSTRRRDAHRDCLFLIFPWQAGKNGDIFRCAVWLARISNHGIIDICAAL
jgi:hypothetical protein